VEISAGEDALWPDAGRGRRRGRFPHPLSQPPLCRPVADETMSSGSDPGNRSPAPCFPMSE